MGVSTLRTLNPARQTLAALPRFAADIKLAHSIFAMPFAAAAFFVAALPAPTWSQALLLVTCMVAARTFAMGMNRLLDWRIDLANPRTRVRQIPSGGLSPVQAGVFSTTAAVVFVAAAFALSPLAGYCATPLLLILMSYSLLKRFTWAVHWYLGICLGLAPVAVEVAIVGHASVTTLLLGLAVALWTGGFDIIYAMQDMAFDRSAGLHSIPGRFGPASALWLSRASFVGMVLLLAAVGRLIDAGVVYGVGVAAIAAILAAEHWLVPDARVSGQSKNLSAAFFNANASVSLIFLFFLALDRWLAP